MNPHVVELLKAVWDKARRFDTAFLLIFLTTFLVTALATIPDYGITFDSSEYYIGDKNFWFCKSLDPAYLDYRLDNVPVHKAADHPDFYANSLHAVANPHHIWPLGPTLSGMSKHVFFTWSGLLDPIDAHHVFLPLLVALLLVTVYRFARQQLGRWQAVIAVLCVASYPRFWAHLHNNLKDVPSTVWFTLVIVLLHRGITTRRALWVVGASLLWGVALASKANALFLPAVVGPWLLKVIWDRRRDRPFTTPSEVFSLLAFPFLGIGMCLLLWPYLLVEFPARLTDHLDYIVSYGGSGPDQWQIIPLVNALVTMPVPVILLLAVGIGVVVHASVRNRGVESFHLLLACWLVIPVLRSSVPRAYDFDVIRHWLEIVPAIAILSGMGGALLLRWLERRLGWHEAEAEGGLPLRRRLCLLLVVLLYFSPIVVWNVRNHPNELVFYNRLVGGLGGAQEAGLPEATDYWGSSYRQGMRWLNTNAEEGALLLVPVAEHIVGYTEKIWLRDDIVFERVEGVPAELVDRLIREYPGAVYVMFITRSAFYTPLVDQLEAGGAHPVSSLVVDGGVLLKIYRVR